MIIANSINYIIILFFWYLFLAKILLIFEDYLSTLKLLYSIRMDKGKMSYKSQNKNKKILEYLSNFRKLRFIEFAQNSFLKQIFCSIQININTSHYTFKNTDLPKSVTYSTGEIAIPYSI